MVVLSWTNSFARSNKVIIYLQLLLPYCFITSMFRRYSTYKDVRDCLLTYSIPMLFYFIIFLLVIQLLHLSLFQKCVIFQIVIVLYYQPTVSWANVSSLFFLYLASPLKKSPNCSATPDEVCCVSILTCGAGPYRGYLDP